MEWKRTPGHDSKESQQAHASLLGCWDWRFQLSLGTAAVPEPWRKQSAHPVRTASQGLNCEFGQMLQ